MAIKDSLTVPKEDLLWLFDLIDYIPQVTLQKFLMVMEQGKVVYGKDNWLTPPFIPREEILRSALRHIKALASGAVFNNDREGLPPVYHAANLMCNAMMILTGDIQGWWEVGSIEEPEEEENEEEEVASAVPAAPSRSPEALREKLQAYVQLLAAKEESKETVRKKMETIIRPTGPIPPMTSRKLNPPVAPAARPRQQAVQEEEVSPDGVSNDLLADLLGDDFNDL